MPCLPDTLPAVVTRGGVMAGLVALSLGVAGCSTEAGPQPLPPVPSVSPAPSEMPIPPEAMAETPQGASAFARYFFDIVNQAYASGDASTVTALSASECESCKNIAADVRRLGAAKLMVDGSRFKVAFAEAAPAEADGSIIVDFRFSSDPYVERAKDGSAVREEPAQVDVDAQVKLRRRGSAWEVYAIRTLP